MAGGTLVALNNSNWEPVLSRAASYIPADAPALLARVIDERAIEEYGVAARNLLQGPGRVAHFEAAMAEAAERAAREQLAEARQQLLALRPDLAVETLLLRGIPGEALVAAAREQAAGTLIITRDQAEQEQVEHEGVIASWSRNRHGDLNGFTLADGTEVRVPPHRGAALAAALPAGTPVLVSGEPRRAHLHAWSVVNRATGAALEAHAPKEAPLGPDARFVVDHAPCDVLLLRV
ncbi:MAG TPA: hypothetical protein VFU72_00430 [Nitrolancea sp.]|nr:hypothetical protein [Nitrolancea sp.]